MLSPKASPRSDVLSLGGGDEESLDGAMPFGLDDRARCEPRDAAACVSAADGGAAGDGVGAQVDFSRGSGRSGREGGAGGGESGAGEAGAIALAAEASAELSDPASRAVGLIDAVRAHGRGIDMAQETALRDEAAWSNVEPGHRPTPSRMVPHSKLSSMSSTVASPQHPNPYHKKQRAIGTYLRHSESMATSAREFCASNGDGVERGVRRALRSASRLPRSSASTPELMLFPEMPTDSPTPSTFRPSSALAATPASLASHRESVESANGSLASSKNRNGIAERPSSAEQRRHTASMLRRAIKDCALDARSAAADRRRGARSAVEVRTRPLGPAFPGHAWAVGWHGRHRRSPPPVLPRPRTPFDEPPMPERPQSSSSFEATRSEWRAMAQQQRPHSSAGVIGVTDVVRCV